MNIRIRQETSADYSAVSNLIQQAYRQVAYSNKKEHLMVDRLRNSLRVAEENKMITALAEDGLAGARG